MNIQLFDNFEEIRAQREQWDHVATGCPFQSWAWLGTWFEHLGTESTPAVLVAIENGQWVGVAPFWIDDSVTMNQKLRFWGDGKTCTDYVGLIASPEIMEDFTFAVVDWLNNECASGGKLENIDLIELEGMAAENYLNGLLREVFEASGFATHVAEIEGCWVTDLPSSWEELNTSFSKSMRRKTKKAVSRVTSDACKIQSSNDGNFESLWSNFVDLHQKRRQMLGDEGCFSDPRFENFLRNATLELIKEGRAELVVIQFDDEPLASMLLFNNGDTNFMYQSGADQTRMKLEPGYQIATVAIQKSIESGFQHFDFMRGDEPYKARWSSKRIPMMTIRFVPRNLRSRIKHNVWLTGQTIKNYLRTRQ